MNMKSNTLTIKQEAFCQSYVRLGLDKKTELYKGIEAYKEAGYSWKNKTPGTMYQEVDRLLKHPKISLKIQELQSKVVSIAEEKFNITAEEILRHLDILRKSNINEYVEYLEFDYPVFKTTTTTTGKGKDAVTITETSEVIERRTEMRFKTFDKLTEEQKMCIESIKQNRYGEIELKLHGKEWTIEKINKHIGFYEKDNSQKQPEITNNIDFTKLSDKALDELEKAYKSQ